MFNLMDIFITRKEKVMPFIDTNRIVYRTSIEGIVQENKRITSCYHILVSEQ